MEYIILPILGIAALKKYKNKIPSLFNTNELKSKFNYELNLINNTDFSLMNKEEKNQIKPHEEVKKHLRLITFDNPLNFSNFKIETDEVEGGNSKVEIDYNMHNKSCKFIT